MSTPLFISSLNQSKERGSKVKLPAMFHFAGTGLVMMIVLLLAGGICLAQTPGGTMVGWGASFEGETNSPAGLTNAIAVAAGFRQSLALKSDGSLYTWGDNYYGQNNIPANLSNVTGIASANLNFLAINWDGRAVAWGSANWTSSETNIVAISARGYTSIGLKADGTIVDWSGNTVPQGLSNVVAVAAGTWHGMALMADGTVAAWGNNSYGQTSIPTGLSDVVAIAAGVNHSIALRANGTVVVWGGQTNVPTGLTNIVSISGGGETTPSVESCSLALKSDGTIVAWGVNIYGLQSVPASLTNVVAMTGGGWHGLAIVANDAKSINIVRQPQSRIVYSGYEVSLSVGAVTLQQPLSYQWQFNGTNLAGQNSSYLAISNVQPANAGLYSVIVSNTNGWVVSSNAVLTVNATPPFFLSQPTNITVGAGTNVILSASANGSLPISFQWLFNSNNIADATNASLSIANVQSTNAGYYSVQISNDYGVTNSTNATLTVNASAPFILTQPTYQWVFPQGGVSIVVVASGSSPLNYQWNLNGTNIQDATNSTLIISNFSFDNVGQYLVMITNTYGSVTSQVVNLNFPPLLTNQPVGQIVFSGSNISFNVLASGIGPLTYQWQLNGTNVPNNIITTVAGGGSSNPGDGGPATNVFLQLPFGVTSDSRGNYFIADTSHCKVRKVDTNGIITTVAGNGTAGYSGDGGAATNASLFNHYGLAIDLLGNVYIADNVNHRIRKVDTNGIISTVAGNGSAAYAGDSGTATNASLNFPNDVAFDNFGNLYIADSSNGRIRKVDTNGVIMTVAGKSNSSPFSGDGSAATNAILNSPQGIELDSINNLYIADTGNSRIRKVDTNGTITTVAGTSSIGFSGDGGLATNAILWHPTGVVLDAFGNAFIADRLNNRVRQIDLNGIITTVAGKNSASFSGDGGAATNASLNSPYAMTMATSGCILIVDGGNNRIRQITLGRSPPLQLNHVVATNAGNYAVVVANAYASVTSSIAPLTVVSLQLSNIVSAAGSNVFYGSSISGPVPVSYQWQFNNANLPNATNATLVLTNVQPPNQGAYDLVVASTNGTLTSPQVTLTVTGLPPANLKVFPNYQIFNAGSNVVFTATNTGSPVLNYQWQFGGTNISWANSSVLTLTNVQLTNEGFYAVVVTNYFGSITSSYALLTDLATALNTSGLTWTSSGNSNWFPETTITHDGVEAAQSGLINNGQSSALQTTVTGPGTLTYWWMFSPLTSPFPNTLSFLSSQGNVSASVNSTTGWQQKTIYLGAGQQTLTWNYSRYSFISAQSTGWVDQVSFTPGGTPPTLTSMSPNAFVRANSNVVFSVGAYGTSPLAYQWQLNGTNLLNKTNAFLSLTGVQPTNAGIYSVIITNSFGAAITNAALWVGQFGLNTASTNLFLSTNGFQLELDGILTTNSVVILGSTDLVNWLPLFTNSATTGSVQFLDVTATNLPTRFYRAQE